MNRGQLIKLVITCSIIISFLSSSGCVDNNGNDDEYSEEDWRNWPLIKSSEEQSSGYSYENSDEIVRFNITDYYITRVIIELTWEDEPSQYAQGTNHPDTFNITIITPWQKAYYSDYTSNPINGEGQILETIVVPEYDVAENLPIGEWSVTIHCVNCGDDRSGSPIIQIAEDSGNSWMLSHYYEYHSNT